MEMDLNARSAKWKREEDKRRAKAAHQLQTEQLKRAAVARAQAELEEVRAQKRLERLEEQHKAEELALEEQRVTGGIKYLQQLRPVPTKSDGDKITLPASALEELNPQNAHELGVFTFELSYQSEDATRKTHAGVLEFTAEEGTVGVPPKVAVSLFQASALLPANIQVRYVRLEKGKFASLQPLAEGFGDREIDFKVLLERSLKAHTTLTVGDVLFVRHGKETFEVVVAELKPEDAVNILNTDLEVAVLPSEAVARAKEAEKQAEQETVRLQALAQERERWKADKMQQLTPEPANEERMQVKLLLRMPDGAQVTRRFLHQALLHEVFELIEGSTGDRADQFQLAARYPRRIFTVAHKEQSLQELQLNGRHEALFVERIASAAETEAVETDTGGFQSKTKLPGAWRQARQSLEQTLDEVSRVAGLGTGESCLTDCWCH